MLPKTFSFVDRFEKYEKNPIIRPGDEHKYAGDCIFNPGAIVIGDEVRLLCRCIDFSRVPRGKNWSVSTLAWARSKDGLNFTLDDEPFLSPAENSSYQGGFEDPRLVWLPDEKLYMLTYTGVVDGSRTPGLGALSPDLENWEFLGEIFPARAVAIIDRRINGKYWAYYGNSSLFITWSDDLRTWHTDKETLISPRVGYFDETLCEAVCAPIVRDEGILLLYNGAAPGKYKQTLPIKTGTFRQNVEDHCYTTGWVLIDRNDPTKVIERSDKPFLMPTMPYELYGIAEYTVFSEGLVNFDGKWIIYYGCSDTRIAAAIAEE